MIHVNREEFIEPTSSKGDITKAKEQRILNAVIEANTEGLTADGKVNLTGLGSFEARNRVSRIRRKPGTGELIQI